MSSEQKELQALAEAAVVDAATLAKITAFLDTVGGIDAELKRLSGRVDRQGAMIAEIQGDVDEMVDSVRDLEARAFRAAGKEAE